MQSVLVNLLKSHRSIRKFSEKSIPAPWLEECINAGKAASSSSFIQCTSIIRITEKNLRTQVMELSGNQSYIEDCAEFLVFCMDFQRHQSIAPKAKLGFTEQVLTGAIDVSLFAQNVATAAESLGLGIVYIGGIRNHPKELCSLLRLPQQVFPLFGLCLGFPQQAPEVKPRLPNAVLVHENVYQSLDKKLLEKYDETLKAYYLERTGNSKSATWSQDIEEKFAREARPFMKEALLSQGFLIY